MQIYVALETANTAVVYVRAFATKEAAMTHFYQCAHDHNLKPWKCFSGHAEGTIAFAGTSYTVQIIEADVEYLTAASARIQGA
jgi:hypothetical protein